MSPRNPRPKTSLRGTTTGSSTVMNGRCATCSDESNNFPLTLTRALRSFAQDDPMSNKIASMRRLAMHRWHPA